MLTSINQYEISVWVCKCSSLSSRCQFWVGYATPIHLSNRLCRPCLTGDCRWDAERLAPLQQTPASPHTTARTTAPSAVDPRPESYPTDHTAADNTGDLSDATIRTPRSHDSDYPGCTARYAKVSCKLGSFRVISSGLADGVSAFGFAENLSKLSPILINKLLLRVDLSNNSLDLSMSLWIFRWAGEKFELTAEQTPIIGVTR